MEEYVFSLTKSQGGLAYKDLITNGVFYIYYFQEGFPSIYSNNFYHKDIFYYYEGEEKKFFHIEREACDEFRVTESGWIPNYSKFMLLYSKLPVYLRDEYFYSYEEAKLAGQYWQQKNEKQKNKKDIL